MFSQKYIPYPDHLENQAKQQHHKPHYVESDGISAGKTSTSATMVEFCTA